MWIFIWFFPHRKRRFLSRDIANQSWGLCVILLQIKTLNAILNFEFQKLSPPRVFIHLTWNFQQMSVRWISWNLMRGFLIFWPQAGSAKAPDINRTTTKLNTCIMQGRLMDFLYASRIIHQRLINKKSPTSVARRLSVKLWFYCNDLVAGVGFEPTTFRLWVWFCKKYLPMISVV